jgi:hypothetical protein
MAFLPQSWNVKMADLDRTDTGGIPKKDWMCLMHWSGPNKPWDHGHEDKIHPPSIGLRGALRWSRRIWTSNF